MENVLPSTVPSPRGHVPAGCRRPSHRRPCVPTRQGSSSRRTRRRRSRACPVRRPSSPPRPAAPPRRHSTLLPSNANATTPITAKPRHTRKRYARSPQCSCAPKPTTDHLAGCAWIRQDALAPMSLDFAADHLMGSRSVAGLERASIDRASASCVGRARSDGVDEAVSDPLRPARVQGLVAAIYRPFAGPPEHEVAPAHSRRVAPGRR